MSITIEYNGCYNVIDLPYSKTDLQDKVSELLQITHFRIEQEEFVDGQTVKIIDMSCCSALDDIYRNGHIDCVKHLVENNSVDSSDVPIYMMATKGHVECLSVLYINRLLVNEKRDFHNPNNLYVPDLVEILECKKAWGKCIMYGAALNGQLECLKWLHENGCPWDNTITTAAAERGHLECLKWLHKNGCPLGNTTAAFSHQSCKSYLDEQRCKWNGLFSFCSQDPKINCLEEMKSGCPINERALKDACLLGHIDCVKYLHNQGCFLTYGVINAAASSGRLEVIKYLVENKCPWKKRTLINCVHGDYVDCLQYLIDQGCPMSSRLMIVAISYNSLKCLIHLHNQGMPLHRIHIVTAATFGSFNCVRYLIENGCNKHEEAINVAERFGHENIADYLRNCIYSRKEKIKNISFEEDSAGESESELELNISEDFYF